MKILLPAILLFVSGITNAQITKGSLLLGGSLSVSHAILRNEGPDNNAKSNGFTFNPSIGKAIKANTILGLGFVITRVRTHDKNYTDASSGWNVNTYIRKYLPLGGDFNLFAQTSAFYAESKIDNEGPNFYTKQRAKSAGLDFLPGLDYGVSRRFHLEITLNDLFRVSYSRTITINNSFADQTDKSLSVETNLNSANPISLGFRFLLSK
jgi:hypothetical protein